MITSVSRSGLSGFTSCNRWGATVPSFVPILSFFLSFCGGASAEGGNGAIRAFEVLSTMERVADWQLNHPVTFEFHWKGTSELEDRYVRIGWDGTVYRRLTLPSTRAPVSATPAPWRELMRIADACIAFPDLPAPVQAAWRRESGVDPTLLLHVHAMEEGSTQGWEMGTFLHGLRALQRISDRPVYGAALREIGGLNDWALGRRIYHADDHCIGYSYLEIAGEDRNPELLAKVQAQFDWILKHPSTQPLTIDQGQQRWTWSDALFMAPPVWLKLASLTGDPAYREFMDREWWTTVDALYSPQQGLFFRDATYFDRREKNGRPIFWSRGNAWVLAALALMLEDMPKEMPSRPRYERLFQALAARVAALQPEDRMWRSSLLDPVPNPLPESSSTALFCYAFARGVRLGLLDAAEYGPRATQTWSALQGFVNPDGHLGAVQQPGAGPGSASLESTAPYGVGAFLMAGAEIYRLSQVAETPAGLVRCHPTEAGSGAEEGRQP
jgi:unsaturated rhamnogalacturonyl hydrolase